MQKTEEHMLIVNKNKNPAVIMSMSQLYLITYPAAQLFLAFNKPTIKLCVLLEISSRCN